MLPRLLILDDLFGRSVPDGRNTDRESLCAHFLWQDVTGDASAEASKQRILQRTADAVFCRAQSPACARVGDSVVNDLESPMDVVRKGWPEALTGRSDRPPKTHPPRWSMVLIDLCFYTGRVTEESHRRIAGMPEGRPDDDDPRGYFGLTLLDAIHREFPELPIFILSSKPREEVSLEFSRRGALGFIDRSAPEGPELLQQALWNHGLICDPRGEVIGQSLPLLLALREARRAASHRENVLIRGERGSGKELVARFVNRARLERVASETQSKTMGTALPLVTVNCAVFTHDLFESELFGIEPSTATGVRGKLGHIEMAKGGDLFLDEIADMPPKVQAAMLRVLQDRKLNRVGGREQIEVDVRFISATNADLDDETKGFRADLLDRLRIGGTIWLPPLRERREDIPLLVEKFVREAEAKRPGIRRRTISPDALAVLWNYDWPGNVRELHSVVFNAVTRHLDVEHLVPQHLQIRISSKVREAAPVEPDLPARTNGHAGAAELIAVLRRTKFDPADAAKWAGILPELQTELARAVARLLGAAVAATKRRTPGHPDGEVLIHPAAKLATGDSKLTASKAADLFKRLLGPLEKELEGDLREAYRISIRLRPKSAGQRAPSNDAPATQTS